MELALLSSDERVKALARRWDSLSRSDRRYVSLDDLCAACDIQPEELFGAVVAATFANGYDTDPLITAVFQYLKNFEAMIREARKEGGSRKRERLLVQAGIL
jgi:hypothetical protein